MCSTGRRTSPDQYEDNFKEEQVPHSNAQHARTVEGGTYLVGPLARYNLNVERLSPTAREAAQFAGFPPPVRNPFKSIVVRGIELLYGCDEALHLVRDASCEIVIR